MAHLRRDEPLEVAALAHRANTEPATALMAITKVTAMYATQPEK
jgi:hypothetical protein